MKRNVTTRLRRRAVPMAAYDRLPGELRRWLHDAALPWSPQTALRLWHKALSETGGDAAAARSRLDAAQRKSLEKDAARIWGPSYPGARRLTHDTL